MDLDKCNDNEIQTMDNSVNFIENNDDSEAKSETISVVNEQTGESDRGYEISKFLKSLSEENKKSKLKNNNSSDIFSKILEPTITGKKRCFKKFYQIDYNENTNINCVPLKFHSLSDVSCSSNDLLISGDENFSIKNQLNKLFNNICQQKFTQSALIHNERIKYINDLLSKKFMNNGRKRNEEYLKITYKTFFKIKIKELDPNKSFLNHKIKYFKPNDKMLNLYFYLFKDILKNNKIRFDFFMDIISELCKEKNDMLNKSSSWEMHYKKKIKKDKYFKDFCKVESLKTISKPFRYLMTLNKSLKNEFINFLSYDDEPNSFKQIILHQRTSKINDLISTFTENINEIENFDTFKIRIKKIIQNKKFKFPLNDFQIENSANFTVKDLADVKNKEVFLNMKENHFSNDISNTTNQKLLYKFLKVKKNKN